MHTLDRDSATALAQERIRDISLRSNEKFLLIAESTKEIDRGWIFFFNTDEFVRTGNPIYSLAGNGPLLVTRDGKLYELPSAIPWEDAIKDLR